MNETYDVLVIGSGFGGAITACRLALAGRSVCVLERGRRWGRSDFPRTTPELARAFWNPRDLGLLDVRAFRRVDVIQASGVGGGSLVYLNVNWRPRPEVFAKRWPKGINFDTLLPYYELSREVLEAKKLSPPEGFPMPPRTTAFFDAVKKTGREPTLVNIAVYTGPPRTNPYSGIPQEPCMYCGNCMFGCPVHAKNTLDLNYLAVAERHGAEVYPLHMVQKIEPLDDGAAGYRVHFLHLHPNGSEPGSVVGRKLVVAAGTMGTNELLLKARDVDRTLPKLSRALGTGFSINGDFVFNGTTRVDRDIDPVRGPSITSGVEVGSDGDGIFISDLNYPNPLLWYIQGSLYPFARIRHTLAGTFAYLGRTFGFTKPWQWTRKINDFFEGNFTPGYLGYLGMGTDASNGRLKIRDGGLEVEWSFHESMRMFRKMFGVLKEFSRALGGKYNTCITWHWPLRKLFTPHPLGGCALSDSPDQGVANEWGEVWSYPNLYVCCGSVVPAALGVAPSGTIAALAERIAEHMAGVRSDNAALRIAPPGA